jgi:hypothetical protein
VKNVHAMRFSCSDATRRAVPTKWQKGYRFPFDIIWRQVSNVVLPLAPLGMEMPPKKAAIIEDESDGNSQPLRELHSITERHRGCSGDCLCLAECCYHMKEVKNAQDTADHDGR